MIENLVDGVVNTFVIKPINVFSLGINNLPVPFLILLIVFFVLSIVGSIIVEVKIQKKENEV